MTERAEKPTVAQMREHLAEDARLRRYRAAVLLAFKRVLDRLEALEEVSQDETDLGC